MFPQGTYQQAGKSHILLSTGVTLVIVIEALSKGAGRRGTTRGAAQSMEKEESVSKRLRTKPPPPGQLPAAPPAARNMASLS